VQREIDSLKRELESLKLLLRTAQAPLSNQVKEPRPEEPITEIKEPVPAKQETLRAEKTEEPHPRQGDNSPDNVNLQEFFYFGVK